jgi:uncharacterized protein YbjT (DUF2867 family)
MRIVVLGGTGLIGSKTVPLLRQGGHEVIVAGPQTGVDVLSGKGLDAVMAGAAVSIDLTNSPNFEDRAVMDFFTTAGRNIVAAEAASGIGHHVCLSIVGVDRSKDSGYFRAKVAQEELIKRSGIPYTIIRSTQFLEFLDRIAKSGMDGDKIRLSPGLFQPIAAEDVAAMVAKTAVAKPVNRTIEIAGPERAPFADFVARYLRAIGDRREVISDPEARYFGARVEAQSLVPLGKAQLGHITLDVWVAKMLGGTSLHP